MTGLKCLLATILSLCLLLPLMIDSHAEMIWIEIETGDAVEEWGEVPSVSTKEEPSEYHYGPFTYKLITEHTIQITRCDLLAEGELVIPDTINGIPVVSIGTGAFADCDTLTSVVLPSGLTGIWERAFYDCDGLTHITIPASVKRIVYQAFADCSNLDTVEFLGHYPTFAMENPDSDSGQPWYDPWQDPPYDNSAFAGTKAVGFYPVDDVPWDNRTGIGSGIRTWKQSCSTHMPGQWNTIMAATAASQSLEGQRCKVCGALLSAQWVPASGQVIEGTCGDNLAWTLNRITGHLTVSGTGDITDPCWLPYAAQIRMVNLKSGVTGICKYAFQNQTNLKYINIPETVTNIAFGAFFGCDSLVYTVQEQQMDCKVTARYLGNAENPYYALISLSSDDFAADMRPDGIPYCFEITVDEHCKLIASTVDRISAMASYYVYYERIRFIVKLPEGLTTIGDDAFQAVPYQSNSIDYSLINKVNLPTSLTSIGRRAFASCRKLCNVTIPDGVRDIGQGAFDNCDSFTQITLPPFMTEVPDWLFNGCNNLKSVTLSDTVTAIGDYAFSDCYSLTSILLPAKVHRIGIVAFQYCTGLKQISFLGSAPVIGQDAFSFVRAGVCYPPEDASWTPEMCENYGGTLTWRPHDGNYTSNGDATCTQEGTKTGTCRYCGVLQTVTDAGSAGHCPGQWITVKEATADEDGLKEQYCTTCHELLVTEVLQKYVRGICGENITWQLDPNTGILTISGSGVMSSANAVPWVAYAEKITAVQISEGIDNLRNNAFDGCTALTWIELPKTMTRIGDYAFFDCTSLTEITLPEGLTQLGHHAFTHCAGLTGIEIPEGVVQIGINTFEGCSQLSYVTLPQGLIALEEAAFFGCNTLTEFILPDSLTTLGARSLYKCAGLTGLTVPAKVTSVGSQVFYKCTGLTELTFTGPAPTFADDAFHQLTATVRYPAGYEDWANVVKSIYNGTITWEAWGEDTPVKPTLTLKTPTLDFRDVITVIAFYTAENTEDVVEMGMITYNERVEVLDINTADYVIPGASYDDASGRYFSASQGIHAKYLSNTVYLACYAKLTDGSYVYTKLAPYSPITYATNQLKNSTNTQLKQLVVAMLNYGAAAQSYFSHNTDQPANSAMTAEQIAFPEAYRADMVSSVPGVPAEKQGGFVNNQGFSLRKPGVSFEGAFSINYFFTPVYEPVDGITLYYWNEADFNAADVLTVENASGAIAMSDEGSNLYRGDVTGIAAKDLAKAVYVAAVYSDGTTTWTSGVLGYSIGAYCSSMAKNTDAMAELAKATAVYGYHAKAYFG